MHKERMFENWRIGLLYLAIVIALPITPVIIYTLTEGFGKSYLYVLMLAVLAPFIYECMYHPHETYGKFLEIEIFACSVCLILASIGSFVFLFWSFADTDNLPSNVWIKIWSIAFIIMLCAPGIVAVIETFRSFYYHAKSDGFFPEPKNIVRGAHNV